MGQGRDPHLYLLDERGTLKMRVRLTYFELSEVDRLLLALAVVRESVLSSFQFGQRYPAGLIHFRALGKQPGKLVLSGRGDPAAVTSLGSMGALIGLAMTAASR
ncbi:MAG: hypothetical protein ACRENX_00340 [Candidatus Dormibacteria bacterium]